MISDDEPENRKTVILKRDGITDSIVEFKHTYHGRLSYRLKT